MMTVIIRTTTMMIMKTTIAPSIVVRKTGSQGMAITGLLYYIDLESQQKNKFGVMLGRQWGCLCCSPLPVHRH